MPDTRERRLARWIDDAPDGAVFLGYGGISPEYSTAVFSTRMGEVRFPFRPSAFARLGRRRGQDAYQEIESGYGCWAASSWEDWHEAMEEYDHA